MDAMVMRRSKRRRREEEARRAPPDLISRLPDDVLCAIITLLPSAGEGARTQILSRRWRPLWRSAPLNLEAKTLAAAKAILASHRGGPCRRLSLTMTGRFRGFPKAAGDLLRLPDLDGLQELELCYFPSRGNGGGGRPVPLFVSRFSPTLRVLTLCCRGSWWLELFPNELDLFLPHLEQLTLKGVFIPEDTFHGVLSRCHALQSLVLHNNIGYSQLRICSRTLRSLGISGAHDFDGEIIVEDTPLLERLFQDGSVVTHETKMTSAFFTIGHHKIRVIQAPKLKILGYLRDSISEFDPQKWSFQQMELVSLPIALRTVKILAVDLNAYDLDGVINLLTWFPCVKKLYLVLGFLGLRHVQRKSNDAQLECLNEHLKIVKFKGYLGTMSEESLVGFFLSNARVLESLEFLVPRNRCYTIWGEEWISMQRDKLCRLARASPGARLSFESEPDCHQPSTCVPIKHIHNLAMDDPFDTSSCACPGGDSNVDYY